MTNKPPLHTELYPDQEKIDMIGSSNLPDGLILEDFLINESDNMVPLSNRPEEEYIPPIDVHEAMNVDDIFGPPPTNSEVRRKSQPNRAKGAYRFDEDVYFLEAYDYVGKTYLQHYVESDGRQALDDVFEAGHGIGFCVGDIIKYAKRFGKKNGYNRDDLLKIMHYTVLAMYVLDNHIDPAETVQASAERAVKKVDIEDRIAMIRDQANKPKRII